MATLRTEATEKQFQDFRAELGDGMRCPLCHNTTIKTFGNWKIVENSFPYDRIAKTHHMIAPCRHVTEAELSEEERKELQELKQTYVNDNYDFYIEAAKKKAMTDHFHLHVIVPKDY